MIGERIRQIRLAQQRSLADIAKRAKISIATLSRIENEKQTLDVDLLLVLARILEQQPNDLLAAAVEERNDGNGIDPVVRKIAAFEAKERTQLWKELTAAQRTQRTRSHRVNVAQLTQQVEELLAQIDFMREELDNVRRRLRRSSPAAPR